ncbi:MAG: InlB B-repeat-containing protein [Firmicutes bacterium]|nr:InlB B-repeat-containing protein [Bacillota bacterium]
MRKMKRKGLKLTALLAMVAVLVMSMFMLTACGAQRTGITATFAQPSAPVTVEGGLGQLVPHVTIVANYDDGTTVNITPTVGMLSGTLVAGQTVTITATVGEHTSTFQVAVAPADGVYTITFRNVLATEHNNPATFDAVPLTLLPASRTGYTFVGWFTHATEGTAVASIVAEGNVIVYARFNIITSEITYNLAGGVNNAENPATFDIHDLPLTLEDATRTGHTFLGWFAHATEGTTPITQITELGNVTLFARFQIITSTLTFNGLETADTNPNSATFNYTHLPLNLLPASRDGYTFAGWFAHATEGTTPIAQITELGNVTLFARFNIITSNITFEGLETTDTNTNPATFNIHNLPLNLVPASRTGYTFRGWFAHPTEGLTPITQITTLGNVTLYARWTADDVFDITFNMPQGATNDPRNPATFIEAEMPITLYDAVKEGYTFLGWFQDDAFVGERVTAINEDMFITEVGHITLYANFEVTEFDITFVIDSEATHANPDYFTIYDLPLILEIALLDDYAFVGWFDAATNGNKVTQITALNDMTLHARFIPLDEAVFTINFFGLAASDNNDANDDIDEITYDGIYNDGPLTIHAAVNPGWTFLGWFRDNRGEAITEIDTYLLLSGTTEINLYARWGVLHGGFIGAIEAIPEALGGGFVIHRGLTRSEIAQRPATTIMNFNRMGFDAGNGWGIIGGRPGTSVTYEGVTLPQRAHGGLDDSELHFDLGGGGGSAGAGTNQVFGHTFNVFNLADNVNAFEFFIDGHGGIHMGGTVRVRAVCVETWEVYTLVDWTGIAGSTNLVRLYGEIPEGLRGQTIFVTFEFDRRQPGFGGHDNRGDLLVNIRQVRFFEQFTITFVQPEGTTNNNVRVFSTGADIPLVDASNHDYIFGGWFMDAELNYPFEGYIPGFVDFDITIYGDWTRRHWFDFDLGVGTVNNLNDDYLPYHLFPHTLLDAERGGFDFVGWFLDYDYEYNHEGILVRVGVGEPVTVVQLPAYDPVDGYEDIPTLFAIFDAEPLLITVLNNDNVVENIQINGVDYEAGEIWLMPGVDPQRLTFDIIAASGYDYVTVTVGGIIILPNAQGEYIFYVDGPVTLIISAGVQSWDFIFRGLTGTAVNTNISEFTLNNVGDALVAPTHAYWLFVGWFWNNQGTAVTHITHAMLGNDVTLYARWQLENRTPTTQTGVARLTREWMAERALTPTAQLVFNGGFVEGSGWGGAASVGRVIPDDGGQMHVDLGNVGGTTGGAGLNSAVAHFHNAFTIPANINRLEIGFNGHDVGRTDFGGRMRIRAVCTETWEVFNLNAGWITVLGGSRPDPMAFTIPQELRGQTIILVIEITRRTPTVAHAVLMNITSVRFFQELEITFNNALETEHSNPTTFSAGATVTLTPSTRAGYRFMGWFDAEVAGETVVTINQDGPFTVWARWEQVFPITLNGLISGDEHNIITAPIASEFPLSLTAVTRAGYIFGGWFAHATEGDIPITQFATTGDRVPVWARFTPGPQLITVNFPSQITGVQLNGIDYVIGNTLLPGTHRLTFNVQGGGNAEVLIGGVFILPNTEGEHIGSYEFTVNAPVTITIRYGFTDFNITFVMGGYNDTNPDNDPVVTVENIGDALAPAISPGWVFLGWFNAVGEEVTHITAQNLSDMTLTARWALNNRNVGGETLANNEDWHSVGMLTRHGVATRTASEHTAFVRTNFGPETGWQGQGVRAHPNYGYGRSVYVDRENGTRIHADIGGNGAHQGPAHATGHVVGHAHNVFTLTGQDRFQINVDGHDSNHFGGRFRVRIVNIATWEIETIINWENVAGNSADRYLEVNVPEAFRNATILLVIEFDFPTTNANDTRGSDLLINVHVVRFFEQD